MRLLSAAACLSAARSVAAGGLLGVDVSSPVGAAAAQCMARTANLSFGVARAWHSDDSGYDGGATVSLRAWAAAGVAGDAYMFPCTRAGTAAAQVAALRGNLSAAGLAPGRIWLDIESNGDARCAWAPADRAANCAFMAELVAAAAADGGRWGVYSSIHEWTTIMTAAADPAGCPVAAALPLWYPHYETPPNPSFSDFQPFGGWARPAAKQYDDGRAGHICGISVDNNYAPVWPPA